MKRRSMMLAAVSTAMVAQVAVAQVSVTQDANPKPTAQELVGKAIEAMGGEALQDKLTLTHSTKMAMGPQTFDATLRMRFPLDLRADVTVPDMGQAMMCSDGKHVWTQDPQSDMYEIDAPDAVPFSVILSPYTRFGVAMLHYTDDLEYDGLAEFGDAKCHKVQIDEKHKAPIKALFFDVKSGLPVGLSLMGPDGSDVSVHFTDWGESEGVKMVTKASVEVAGTPIVLTFGDFAWNTVEEDVFAMPPAVKKQIAEADDDDAGHTKDTDKAGNKGDDDDDK